MIDQHFPDAPYITFSRFDAADQVRRCKDAAIDSLHVTTKCHWGHSYYRTETGLMHPALKGRDMVGELVAESRRAGIEAIAYYCILFENLAARNHRDWRFITKEGKPAIRNELFGATGADSWRWDMPCFMTGYRQYCLDQIAEIAAGYEFDGLFLDIFALGSDQRINVCHCAACLARYAERGLDPHSDDPQMKFALVKHWMANWAEFLLEIKGVLRDHRPGMSVSVNGGPFYEPWSVLKELSWPYSEGGENPHNSVVLRGLGLGSPQCGIPCGNDAYDAWPPDLVKIMTSTVLAHGCRTFFFFLQGRLGDGTFEESKYDFVRRINEETAAKQEYVKDAEPLKAAAVYHSEATWMEYGSRDCRTRHAGNIQVAIDAFRAVSIPCEFLPSWRIEPADLDPFQLVVLPEQKCVSDREAEALARYVERGGTLLATGDTGTLDNEARPRSNFALANLLGVDYEGVCEKYSSQYVGGYMRFDEHAFFGKLRKTDYVIDGDFLKVRARDAEVLARVAEPVGVESRDNYIGWHSLPPGGRAEWPCVTVVRRGKGTAVYCVAPLGQLGQDGLWWPAALIQGIAAAQQVSCGFRLEGPEGASEATFFRKGDVLIVHVLNQSVRNNRGAVVPLRDCRICCERATPKAARTVYPVQESLAIEGRTITLPPVEIHTVVEVDIQA